MWAEVAHRNATFLCSLDVDISLFKPQEGRRGRQPARMIMEKGVNDPKIQKMED